MPVFLSTGKHRILSGENESDPHPLHRRWHVLETYRVSPYRWVILLCMIPALAMVDVYWVTFAPITSETAEHYHVSPLSVALLSMSFMIVYVFATFPASWLVDTKGFRVCVGTGALLIAVFGMLRGVYASSFTIVTIAQIGIAAGQPFLVNSITKVAARWFPVNERAMATGIAALGRICRHGHCHGSHPLSV